MKYEKKKKKRKEIINDLRCVLLNYCLNNNAINRELFDYKFTIRKFLWPNTPGNREYESIETGTSFFWGRSR